MRVKSLAAVCLTLAGTSPVVAQKLTPVEGPVFAQPHGPDLDLHLNFDKRDGDCSGDTPRCHGLQDWDPEPTFLYPTRGHWFVGVRQKGGPRTNSRRIQLHPIAGDHRHHDSKRLVMTIGFRL